MAELHDALPALWATERAATEKVVDLERKLKTALKELQAIDREVAQFDGMIKLPGAGCVVAHRLSGGFVLEFVQLLARRSEFAYSRATQANRSRQSQSQSRGNGCRWTSESMLRSWSRALGLGQG